MKKTVSTILALSILAAPMGAMTSYAEESGNKEHKTIKISISTNSTESSTVKTEESEETVAVKNSHKMRNAAIAGAVVTAAVAAGVITHKYLNNTCDSAACPKNKGLDNICKINSYVGEKASAAKSYASEKSDVVLDEVKSMPSKIKARLKKQSINKESDDYTAPKNWNLEQETTVCPATKASYAKELLKNFGESVKTKSADMKDRVKSISNKLANFIKKNKEQTTSLESETFVNKTIDLYKENKEEAPKCSIEEEEAFVNKAIALSKESKEEEEDLVNEMMDSSEEN